VTAAKRPAPRKPRGRPLPGTPEALDAAARVDAGSVPDAQVRWAQHAPPAWAPLLASGTVHARKEGAG
jgi:hypothetical protein